MEQDHRSASEREPSLNLSLRRLQWSIAVVAGLAGAIAVHLIFVGTYLPDIVIGLTPSSAKALIAVADFLGAALAFVAAAPRG